jgi:hypothetical protein
LDFGDEALFQAISATKMRGTPQKSLLILLDFLVRIERFQGITLTPRAEISFRGSSPRNDGTRALISPDRAPRGVRRRTFAYAVDRAFHGDEDLSTDSDLQEEQSTEIFFRDRANCG